MNKPLICIIVAIAEDLAIGKNNKLLWNIPEDLQHFKKITSGHPVIMGENTFYSIGKPLPNRLNIVLSPNMKLTIPGAKVCNSIPEAIKLASSVDQEEIFFIGGGQVYKQALEIADKLYLTIVEGKFDADTFFPEYRRIFKKVISEKKSSDKSYHYRFLELVRDNK